MTLNNGDMLGDTKSIALFAVNTRRRCDEDCFLDIWVMKEYGRKESWTRLITLGPQGPERFLPTGPICFRKSGEVLLLVTSGTDKSWKELILLDLVSKQLKKLGISGYQSSDGYQYHWTSYLTRPMQSLTNRNLEASS
ncbi:unnamed protein product [Prunus armeniaca]